jgi:hypothetical protein
MATDTDTTPALPVGPPDWLDGATEVELSTRHLWAKWDADILDIDDKNKHDTIIERKDEFLVRFRVYLGGRLWRCLAGCWCFDVCFTAIGDGPNFNLSDRLPDKSELCIRDWRGCDGLYIERYVRVPGSIIPERPCGILYEVGCKFELRCCGCCEDEGSSLAVAGHERQGEYMFV